MTSNDDDTLPLPEFSQELTPDVTVDEDFIPTSQPQSIVTSKISKNSDISFNESSEELSVSNAASISRIDDTLPREAIFDQSTFENKSADFIPDTETKKLKINYANEDISCKKKLAVFASEDAFGTQLNPHWEGDISRIPESPGLDTQNFSILKDSPSEIQQDIVKKSEELTEIIVNDSADTVDLEASPVKIKMSDIVGKAEIYCSSDVDRCEETQIFDNSSVLLLDQPGPSGLSLENTERISEVIEKSYLQETIDDNKENSQDRANNSGLQCSPAFVDEELSKNSDFGKRETAHETEYLQNEVQTKQSCTEESINSITLRKMEFKLTVSCFVTVNTATNKIIKKSISNVKEIHKPKPKSKIIEQPFDTMSEKSKRTSTSSSGSVYSDKTGIPFAPPKRLSVISDQTDSSEDDFSSHMKRGSRKHERTPWSNEYLFFLAMDDIIQNAIEKEDFFKRPTMSSPKKPKTWHRNTVNQLKEILESSSSSRTSLCDSVNEELQPTTDKMESTDNSEVEKTDTSEAEKTEESIKDNVQNETDTNVGVENVQSESKTENQKQDDQTRVEEEPTSITLSDGLPVFARWTDKRYYSGALSGDVKNDRWDVKFDDGTSKTVREDFIMPADWLKVGALVFALVDDKYVSGQIVDIKRGDEVNYVVELDIEKQEVSVKMSDLCLTDVMAGIVREKYKPLSATPRGRADIDFDNVVSGKRLREQRTPLKPPVNVGTGSSGAKKKSRAKKDKDQSLQSIKETPESSGLKIGGLKSDNGHLIEDKVISADSPSGNETGETPLRKTSKEPKGKAKPRSLSYENEETRSGKGKSWLASDGTPIPGPSGVKSKKQRTKAKTEEPESVPAEEIEPVPKKSKKSPGKAPQSSEKSKRKRKLDETVEENIQKKSLKEGSSRARTRSRKGI